MHFSHSMAKSQVISNGFFTHVGNYIVKVMWKFSHYYGDILIICLHKSLLIVVLNKSNVGVSYAFSCSPFSFLAHRILATQWCHIFPKPAHSCTASTSRDHNTSGSCTSRGSLMVKLHVDADGKRRLSLGSWSKNSMVSWRSKPQGGTTSAPVQKDKTSDSRSWLSTSVTKKQRQACSCNRKNAMLI